MNTLLGYLELQKTCLRYVKSLKTILEPVFVKSCEPEKNAPSSPFWWRLRDPDDCALFMKNLQTYFVARCKDSYLNTIILISRTMSVIF